MSVVAYSKKASGEVLLSEDFKVKEFACNDGSDVVLIDTNLVKTLQKVRDWAGAPVSITSGYRTKSYNAKVGGASNSYHTKGQACDIVVSGKTSTKVAAFLETIGAKGIMDYQTQAFTHVDTRQTKYWAKVVNGVTTTVQTHGGASVAGKPAGGTDMTTDQVKEIAQDVADKAVKHAMETMQSILTDGNAQLPAWAKTEFDEAIKAGITDGDRPTAYATRVEVAVMANRARKDK